MSALPTDGKIFVQFSDSRDAARAREKVRVLHQNWHIVPLTAREFASQTTGFKPDQVSDFEGQIQLKITDEHDHDHAETMTTVRLVTSKIGDIKVFYPLPVDMASSREFIIEYFDVRDAENAAMALDNNRVEVCIRKCFSPQTVRTDAQERVGIFKSSCDARMSKHLAAL